ncbi:hypothetical protein CRUP_025575, partial [Coryphaenoides rupestris]
MEHRHRKKDTPVPASTHHLFVNMKSLMSANLGEELEVFFHIYDGRENRPIRCNTESEWHQIHENIIKKVTVPLCTTTTTTATTATTTPPPPPVPCSAR